MAAATSPVLPSAPLASGTPQVVRRSAEPSALAVFEAEERLRRLRERRWMWSFGAVCIVAFIPIDWLTTGALVPQLVLVRVLGAAVLIGVHVSSPRVDAAVLHALLVAGGCAISATFAVVSLLTGGIASPYASILYAIPLAYGLLVPAEPRVALGVGIGNALAGAMVHVSAGTFASLVTWTGISACLAGFVFVFARHERASLQRQFGRAVEHGRLTNLLDESEKRRKASERFAMLGQISASVAHEIKNPLAVLKANVGFLWEAAAGRPDDPAASEQREAAADSVEALQRIEAIVGDLRSVAREGLASVRPVQVEAFLEPALRIARLRAGDRVRFEVDIPPDLPDVAADEGRMVQVMVNLLVNAVEALDEAHRRGRVRLEASTADGTVLLSVEDDGPGIPAPVLEGIFTAGLTTKPLGKGTGLGLILCREYLTQMGGTIRAVNVEGSGARFQVVLARA